jgi:hypothetical protein
MMVECYFEENMQYVDIDDVIEEQEALSYSNPVAGALLNNPRMIKFALATEISNLRMHRSICIN